MRKIALLIAFGLPLLPSPVFAGDGDPRAGQTVFRKCAACHKVGPDAKNSVGPVLNGIVGRPTGAVKDYNYSALNKAAGDNGLVWTEDNLFNYLANPKAFLTTYLSGKNVSADSFGNTKMVLKFADEQQRKDVIAYLKSVPATTSP